MLNDEDADTVVTDCKAMRLLKNEGDYIPVHIKGATECKVEESLIECLNKVLKVRNEGSLYIDNNQDNLDDYQEDSSSARLLIKTEKRKELKKKEFVVFFEGKQLDFILQDQSLEKLFLSLCNLCSMSIGTSVTAQQK